MNDRETGRDGGLCWLRPPLCSSSSHYWQFSSLWGGSAPMASKSGELLSAATLRSILDQLSVAIVVFRGQRVIYANPRATRLIGRLRGEYGIELVVMLLDHLA